MNCIDLEGLLEIHVLVIQETGGSDGIRDLGRLESALATQTQVVFGEELYSTIFAKAAALMRAIIADHAFVDGNKRTGTLAALTFVEKNGYHIDFQEGEVENFAVKVATDKLDVPVIASWLEEHSKKVG
ncbi:MAG: type II toxin-antitoxin system death-on-curing family toxin [Candidatus Saccharimonadales bacterium]